MHRPPTLVELRATCLHLYPMVESQPLVRPLVLDWRYLATAARLAHRAVLALVHLQKVPQPEEQEQVQQHRVVPSSSDNPCSQVHRDRQHRLTMAVCFASSLLPPRVQLCRADSRVDP